jgi:hypothetical protein
MELSTEQLEMESFLEMNSCVCGKTLTLTGECFYSDPLQWPFECKNCGKTGILKYDTISIRKNGMLLPRNIKMIFDEVDFDFESIFKIIRLEYLKIYGEK